MYAGSRALHQGAKSVSRTARAIGKLTASRKVDSVAGAVKGPGPLPLGADRSQEPAWPPARKRPALALQMAPPSTVPRPRPTPRPAPAPSDRVCVWAGRGGLRAPPELPVSALKGRAPRVGPEPVRDSAAGAADARVPSELSADLAAGAAA